MYSLESPSAVAHETRKPLLNGLSSIGKVSHETL
jgi:hypothetical protein